MTTLENKFKERFSIWNLIIPEENALARSPGKIRQAGWSIHFRYGTDDQGEFLDYYCAHRMAGEDHVRIRADGREEQLPSITSVRLTSDNPEEDARLEAEFFARNQKVLAMLIEKGFVDPDIDAGAVGINRALSTGNVK